MTRFTFETSDVRFAGRSDGGLWFCVRLRGGWTACYRLMPSDGRPTVAELRVLPTPPGEVVHVDGDNVVGHHETPEGGLTAGLLKDEVVVGRHVYERLPNELRRAKAHEDLYEVFFGSLAFDPESKPPRARRGPKADPPEDYARWAATYVKFCEAGERAPVVATAEAHNTEPETMRSRLERARRRGLLTRQTAGRAGGELTDRARELLKEEGGNDG